MTPNEKALIERARYDRVLSSRRYQRTVTNCRRPDCRYERAFAAAPCDGQPRRPDAWSERAANEPTLPGEQSKRLSRESALPNFRPSI